MENTKKNLIIFDFDHTILSDNSDTAILKLLSDEAKKELENINNGSGYGNWAKHMQHVYNLMKKEGVAIEQVKAIVEEIEFNEGFHDLFTLIRDNKDRFDCVIVSGANTLFLQWVLDKYNLHDLFCGYYTNIAEPDESCVIRIKQYHEHDCETCDKSQCKRIIMDNHLQKCNIQYDNMFYLGDGSNDFCPALLLRENDYLFPRYNFPLHNKLYNKNFIEKLKCKVLSWHNAHAVIEVLKKIL
jgi:pyridoxal phosphate phosphatase PHOSPHO2